LEPRSVAIYVRGGCGYERSTGRAEDAADLPQALLAHHAGLAFASLGRAPLPQLSVGTALRKD